MRLRLLPLAVIAISSLSWGASDGLRVRASLDEESSTSAAAPGPRHIRSSLDEATAPVPLAVSKPEAKTGSAVRLEAAPRRLLRLSLDSEAPPPDGRLIRLSLEDSGTVYGRLPLSGPHGRYVRVSLD